MSRNLHQEPHEFVELHQDPTEAEVCPLCNSPVDEPTEQVHLLQGIVWSILKSCPAQLLAAELRRRKLLNRD